MAENHHPGQNQPPAGLSRLASAVLLAAGICGFYWKLLFTKQFTWLAGGDMANQVLPWFQFQAAEFHAGRVPLWDPFVWFGQPLIGQAQPGSAYPLNWILFALPLSHGFIRPALLNWYMAVIHFMAAGFAYLLARDLKASRPAAVFAGLAFSLLGWMGDTDWPQMLNGAVWAPLVLMFAFRIARGRDVWRSAVYGGVALGMAWLSGHHQPPVFMSIAAGAVLLWAGLRNRRLLAAAGVLFAVAAGAGALQILPALEYGRHSVRWIGLQDPVGWNAKVPWTIHREFSAKPDDLLGIVLPGVHTHASPYTGAVTFALAIAGFWLCRKCSEARWLGAIALGAALYAMSGYAPVEGLLYSLVPLVEKARNPSAAFYLMGLGAAVLAALGLDRLLENPVAARRTALWLGGFGVFVFAVRAAWVLTHPNEAPGASRILIGAVCALLMAALLAAARRGRLGIVSFGLAASALMAVEASNENGYSLPALADKDRVAMYDALWTHQDIARFLQRQPGNPRVVIDSNIVQYNFGDWHGVRTTNGYLASLTTSVTGSDLANPDYSRLMAVAYRVGDKPSAVHTEEVFAGSSGLKVYRDPQAGPPAFAVHEILPWGPKYDAPGMLHLHRNRLREAAFVEGPPPRVESCPDRTSKVEIRAHSPAEVRMRAEMGCRGMVVLADSWFPGWKATVDGVESPIHKADGGLLAVAAGAGSHEIVMTYRPASVLAGAALTLGAWLGAAVVFVLGRRRRAGESDQGNSDNIIA